MLIEDSEYKVLEPNQDLQKRKEYWAVAKGLQKIDGLQTSEYLETVIQDTLDGKYKTVEAEERVREHYATMDPQSQEFHSKEADIVAARITVCLERDAFKFSPVSLKAIHKELFHDVFPYKWVGEYRTENLTKAEAVLGGRSMTYGDYMSIPDLLQHDFDVEKNVSYNFPLTQEDVQKFSNFISAIWQAHPFREGNTRTISTFAIKYLRTLGVEIDNTPFQERAKWFRDALVRSNYTNLQMGIRPDFSYLYKFFENVILSARHDLGEIVI